MTKENTCPFCGSEETSKFHKRHNFDIPNPFNKKQVGILTIRFPLFKCQSCNEEFGSFETQNTIESAVEEYIKKCFDEYQRNNPTAFAYKNKEENSQETQEMTELKDIKTDEIMPKNDLTIDNESTRQKWFILGSIIGLFSMFVWPLMLLNAFLGTGLIIFIVALIVTGIFINDIEAYVNAKL